MTDTRGHYEEYRIVGFKINVLHGTEFYEYKIMKVGIDEGRVLFITNIELATEVFDPIVSLNRNRATTCNRSKDEDHTVTGYFENQNLKIMERVEMFQSHMKNALSKPIVYNEGDI